MMKLNKTIICMATLSIILAGYSSKKLISIEERNTNDIKDKTTVQAMNKRTTSNLRNSIKDVEIVQLQNGKYMFVSNNSLEKQIRNLKGITKIQNPTPIKIIKPIERLPIKKDFKIPDINPQQNAKINDPGYKYQWAITATQSEKAWTLVSQKREIKVAVLDTGIDYNHPDLKNRVLKNLGYDFVNEDSDPIDDNGHGTHVSGIIAAEANNKQGICGIVGTLDVKIIPIKVLNKNGEGDSDIIAKGIRYATDQGADIINLSFGCVDKNTDIENALIYAQDKGVFTVAAAGNDNTDCNIYTPAGDKESFTVSAVDTRLRKAAFSNYGSNIEVASPGVRVLSTVPNGNYEAWDGTSMSAPIVSGIAAIIKAENPTLSPAQIKSLLENSSKDILTKGKDIYSGYGLVNAYTAIQKTKAISKI
ncbi:S8 family peptidase [Clostridium lundense]|uniref:S8 family peptidase n=1 Tax=Clostridium lundense TaxID=319475 RepID=UPI000A0547EF|nr:S8 family peptidase [Clostridium lundense]